MQGNNVFHSFNRDMYEGTRTAREEDFSGIRKILRPLEESGVLVQRTDEEVPHYHADFEQCKH